MMNELKLIPIETLTDDYKITNPYLQRMHQEADAILDFMKVEASLQDPTSLTYRLNQMDAYLARLTGILSKAKAMREYAKSRISKDNATELLNMKKTVSDRIISAYLCELTVTCDRLETLYNTLCRQSNDLQSQISYIRNQMRCGM